MIATSSNADDIRRYFQGTYVKFREFGDTLFYIQEVNSERIWGQDENQDDFVVYLSNQHPYSLDYVLPNRAVFQYSNRVAMLQRIPARQYRRGLSEDNTKMFFPSSGTVLDINFTTLKKFVRKTSYRSLKEALFGKGKDKEIALNSRMWFNRNSQTLMCDVFPIGVFDRANSSFLAVPSILKQDVEALIRQDPFECKVL